MTNQPFKIIRHSTDSENLPIVDVRGTYLSNPDAIKLRDELNRLLPDDRLLRENEALREALKRALPWLGKALAEEVHVGTSIPKDLLATLEQAKATLAQVEGGVKI